jgi:hypothetical protein
VRAAAVDALGDIPTGLLLRVEGCGWLSIPDEELCLI